MTVEELRKFFPLFQSENNKYCYLDNAATSQRPYQVLDAQRDYAAFHNGNIHRAVHRYSVEATDAYETARNRVKEFLNARSREEIIFTTGTTASVNLVAYSFGAAFVGAGDEVIVGEAEHHSNFVPWQLMCRRNGAKIVYWRVREDGSYNLDDLRALIGEKTKIVAVQHASNVLGVVNPIEEIVNIAHAASVPVFVDGAQGCVHQMVDVQRLNCDFYAFSAHKLYGPTGVGVLYGKREILESMPPFLAGGEMIGNVSLEETTFAPLPMKFEAGTQNFNSVAALAPALDFATMVNTDAELAGEAEAVKDYLQDSLLSIPGLVLYGNVRGESKLPVFSFNVSGVHHEDLAILLDKMGVAVRSGQMCAEPLMNSFAVTGMVRASLLPYNTKEDVDHFISSLKKAIKMLSL